MPTKDEKAKFSALVIEYVEKNDTDYMDAIVTVSEKLGYEIEVAASLLTDVVKAALRREQEDLNTLKRGNKRLL